MPETTLGSHSRHKWRFFRAGGFDQVKLETGADIDALDQLDQKLWVALACPTRGLEFDIKTLDLIDTDKDGRVRAPEIIAAAKWACKMLKNPDELTKGLPALPLSSINDANDEAKQLFSSARQILLNLGKTDAADISVDDTTDTAKIFAQTKFNGDGIIPADASDDPAVQSVITDIITCLGGEQDRSGKLGITQAKADLFFTEAAAFAGWHSKASADANVLPVGPNTAIAAAAIKAVAGKIDDYFVRCRLTSFDPRTTAAVNRLEADYVTAAAKELSLACTELTSFPLARVEAGRPLPLIDGINPAWRTAIESLNAQVIKPMLGEKTSLTEAEWAQIVAKFAPFDAWLATKAGAPVEKLSLPRVQEILAGPFKTTIDALLAKDKALEPEANAIAAVDTLVRYYRDLHKLLNNFVAFRDFYGRRNKAIFQAGTLYLDQRSCDLCVRVEDAAKHGSMAHLAYTYLTYCDLTRKATNEKMSIAAAFTAGDSDNLMVGRNGIFYDRKGQDWDATITKIVENPISIRQAFWSPYKRLARWIQDQIAKRAAAADAASTNRMTTAASTVDQAMIAPGVPVPPPPPPPAKKLDIGVVAALGVAVGALTTALGILLNWLSGVSLIILPVYVVGVMLLISTPSMILAALKLRQRNLGPILDANAWAVNARARINIPFGGSLTQVRKLPPGASRDLHDAFAESHAKRNWIIAAIIVVLVAISAWYFGCCRQYLPDWVPQSGYVQRKETAQAADRILTEAQDDFAKGNLAAAAKTLDQTDKFEKLPTELVLKISNLRKDIKNEEAKAVPPATSTAPAK